MKDKADSAIIEGIRFAKLLDPNVGLDRIERDWPWSLPIQEIALGVPCNLHVSSQPIVTVRPTKLVMNVPAEGLFVLEGFLVGNQSMLDGEHDACVYGTVEVRGHGRCDHCGA